MAISASAVWEVRPSLGSDLNGGSYDSSIAGAGTDYSQQNAPQVAVTDAVTNNTTTVTSATAAFTSAMIGNAIYLSGAGTTTGRYFITAVTNSTTITVDRATGSTGGTGVSLNLGGALATLAELYSARGMVGANIAWLKNSGTLSLSSASYTPPGGTSSILRTCLIGYNTTRGDLDSATTFTNHPQIVVNNAALIVFSISNSYQKIANVIVDAGVGATKGSIALNTNASNNYELVNCKISGAWTSRAITMYGVQALHRCYITGAGSGATAAVQVLGGQDNVIDSSYIAGNSCPGVSAAGSVTMINSIVDSNSGASSDGIVSTANTRFYVERSTIRNNGRDGIRLASTPSLFRLFNCLLTENGGYGVNFGASAQQVVMGYNAYWSNTSGNLSNSVALDATDKTLTGSPYANSAGGDFSLNNTAGAGASCRASGEPGLIPGSSTTGYGDIGAVQHQDAGGGGTNPGFIIGG